jgi:hypothetical protein
MHHHRAGAFPRKPVANILRQDLGAPSVGGLPQCVLGLKAECFDQMVLRGGAGGVLVFLGNAHRRETGTAVLQDFFPVVEMPNGR